MSILTNVIGSALGLGSSILGYLGTKQTNKTNINLANQTNAFNSAQAQINRDYETQMSNTAHQREVADLKQAGLNPVLSAGAGASTPAGATATGVQATAQDKMAMALSSMNMYLQNAELINNIKNSKEITTAQSKNLNADTKLKEEQAKYTGYVPETESYGGNLLGLLGLNKSSTTYNKINQPKNSAMDLKNFKINKGNLINFATKMLGGHS